MRKKLVLPLCAFLMLALLVAPTNSWVYQDGTPSDQKFEKFGPRVDRLFIKFYPNETAEWEALSQGEIDIADQPLSKEYYELFISNETNLSTGLPYNETIGVFSYGSGFRLYILDLNNNPNWYTGYPPDPAYPNPVYPNPTSVKEMRQAIAHLVRLDIIIGKGFYTPLYTIVPLGMGDYAHSEIKPGGLLDNLTYPYSRVAAEALLDAGGFPVNSSTGWRFWDRNGDRIEQSDEYLELKFIIREDDAYRFAFGNFLADELNAVKVRVERIYGTVQDVMPQVMLEKDFHLYTGGWSLAVDPLHLALWHSSSYWHPGFCYNYAFVNDSELDSYIDGVIHAETFEEAKENAWAAQRRFAEIAASIPVWAGSGFKAVNRHYTGGTAATPVTPDDGENQYRGQYWMGIVNKPGEGIDNFWSFLNMHPFGYERGHDENLTIRWGFKVRKLYSLNPIFAEWIWDWKVLSLSYESLLACNPNDRTEFIPWLASNYEIGTYEHPVYGECTKVRFTLRPDATWHDGTPITVADVYFTWVELCQILHTRGLPCPGETWIPGIGPWPEMTIDFKIIDPYNFEMLFYEKDIWVLSWISSRVILPKHIWKPIAETGPVTDFAPDPNLIGSGPYRITEYVEGSHILLVANKPGSTVQTNLLGSTPVTSPKGYWRYHPAACNLTIDGVTLAKVDYYAQPHTVNLTMVNLYHSESITTDIRVSFTFQNGTTVNHVYFDVMLNSTNHSGSSWTTSETIFIKGRVTVNCSIQIKQPAKLAGTYSYTYVFWSTVHQDIAGSTLYDELDFETHPYKEGLPSPDTKIDIIDIAITAIAFGTAPGYERWKDGIGDVNHDYNIDILDVTTIAKKYGWIG